MLNHSKRTDGNCRRVLRALPPLEATCSIKDSRAAQMAMAAMPPAALLHPADTALDPGAHPALVSRAERRSKRRHGLRTSTKGMLPRADSKAHPEPGLLPERARRRGAGSGPAPSTRLRIGRARTGPACCAESSRQHDVSRCGAGPRCPSRDTSIHCLSRYHERAGRDAQQWAWSG